MKKGWQIRTIGEVCHLMTGGTPSRAKPEYFGGEIKWLVSGDINQGEIFDCEGRITEEGMKNSNTKFLPVNSVMIALNGQGKTRGTVALLRTKATCNQSLVSIYPNEPDKLLPEFIYANLHGRYQEIRTMTGDSGNDRRGLNMILIKGIEIPIAPLAEQQRIVGLLEEAFARLATAQANVEKNLQNALALFESHLQSVFTQRGKVWAEKRLEDVCEIGDGNHSSNYPKKEELVAEGVPFIRATNLVAGTISDDDMRFLSPKKHAQLRKGHLKTGDILFTNRGEIGKTAIVDSDHDGSNLNSQIAWLRCRETLNNRFLFHVLNSGAMKSHLELSKNGAALQQFTIRQIKELKIPIPPKDQQKALVISLDGLSDETQRLAALYEQKRSALEALKKSLLHEAFSGNL